MQIKLYSNIKTNYDLFQLISFKEIGAGSISIFEKYNKIFNILKLDSRNNYIKDKFLLEIFSPYIINDCVYEIDYNRLLIMFDEAIQDIHMSDVTEQLMNFLEEIWAIDNIKELNIFSMGFVENGSFAKIIEAKTILEIKECYLMRTWKHSIVKNNFEYYPISNFIFRLRK